MGYGRGFISALLNGLEHVARLRDARPVNLLLGLADLSPLCSSAIFPGALKVLAHALGFVFLERAGVRFLFGHTNGRQGVKDRPAFHFQFAC
jgi:hypothetical protein